MAIGKAGDAIMNAEKGRCAVAYKNLVDAVQWNGIEAIHATDGGLGKGQSDGIVQRAVTNFERNCVRRG